MRFIAQNAHLVEAHNAQVNFFGDRTIYGFKNAKNHFKGEFPAKISDAKENINNVETVRVRAKLYITDQ